MKRSNAWHLPAGPRDYLVDLLLQLVVLAVAVAIGLRFARIEPRYGVIWGLLTLYYAHLIRRAIVIGYWGRKTALALQSVVSDAPLPAPGGAPYYQNFSVFLAAYKASDIIHVTLHKLASQDYPHKHYQVYVVTETSEVAPEGGQTTAEAILGFIGEQQLSNFTHLVSHHRTCKAEALNIAYQHLIKCNKYGPHDFVLVLDSDSLLPRNALRIINDEINQDGNYDVIRQMASIPMANYDSGDILTKLIALADAVGAVGKWARSVRGWRRSDLHAGSGVVIPLKLLHFLASKYGLPWDTTEKTITEDARLIIGRYALLSGANMKTRSVPCPLIEAVPFGATLRQTYRSFWLQRSRWATGGYDEFFSLLCARPDQIFIDPTSYTAYRPDARTWLMAQWRRLTLLGFWIMDHFWWGLGSFVAPFLWLYAAHWIMPPNWMLVIGFSATALLPVYFLWICAPPFFPLGQVRSTRDIWRLYFASFLFAFVYQLPIVFTQLVCIFGGRRLYNNWNPTTVKPATRQVPPIAPSAQGKKAD